MNSSFERFQTRHGGCSDQEIAELESKFDVRLPGLYRRFLSRFGHHGGASSALRGSDYCMPRLLELRGWAEELLTQSGSPFILHSQDFVLAMHQGYQFYYFRADGAIDDPPVFYYHEGWKQPEQKFNTVSDWLEAFGAFVA